MIALFQLMKMELNKFPLLKTTRLTLRQLTNGDLNQIKNNISESIVEFLPLIPWPYTLEDAKNYLFSVETKFNDGTELTWGIEFESNLIGTISITFEDFDKVRLAYLLNGNFQRRGFMYESVLKIINFCFTDLNVNKIYTGVIVDNLASLNLLKKIGFVVDGINRQHIKNKDIYVDEILLSLLRCDFEKQSKF